MLVCRAFVEPEVPQTTGDYRCVYCFATFGMCAASHPLHARIGHTMDVFEARAAAVLIVAECRQVTLTLRRLA